MKRCALVLLATSLVAAPAIAGEDLAKTAWLVRTWVASNDDPCDGTALVLHIDDRLDASLRVPLITSWTQDVDWEPLPLSAGTHRLYAQFVSCTGVKSAVAVVEFEHGDAVRTHSFYVGLQSNRGTLSMDYLEASTEWDGSEFFRVTRAGDTVAADLVVTNLSDRPFRPCTFGYRNVREEFLVEGNWIDPPEAGTRRWPKGLETLEPGAYFSSKPTVIIVRKYVPPPGGLPIQPREVRPTAKRYLVEVAPRTDYFQFLSEPRWAPGGLPSCDYYHLEYPAEETDPTLEFWDPPEDTNDREPE